MAFQGQGPFKAVPVGHLGMSHTSIDNQPARFDFLQPLVHYIKPIFAASSPAEHSAALAAAQGYLDAVLAENQAVVHKLTSERGRVQDICHAPQYDGRYCRVLCEGVASTSDNRPSHQATLHSIEDALRELAVEENLINLWRLALAQPLHCLLHRQAYHIVYPTEQGDQSGRHGGRTVVQVDPAAVRLPPTTSARVHPVTLAKKSSTQQEHTKDA